MTILTRMTRLPKTPPPNIVTFRQLLLCTIAALVLAVIIKAIAS